MCRVRCNDRSRYPARYGDALPGQFALLGIQLMWTTDVQDALMVCMQKRNALKDANHRSTQILSELSSWCLQDLKTKMNRTKIETLITIQVHQRDVLNHLHHLYKNKQIAGAGDFEWQKQARFHWRPDDDDAVEGEGSLTISVTDVDFNYSYEYLGCEGPPRYHAPHRSMLHYARAGARYVLWGCTRRPRGHRKNRDRKGYGPCIGNLRHGAKLH